MEGASELSRAEAGDRREPLDSLMIDRDKRLRAEILVTQPQQVECEQDQLVRLVTLHRSLQGGKVGQTIFAHRANLAVNDAVIEATSSLGDLRECAGVIETFARTNGRCAIFDADLHAPAVQLHLVNPVRPVGRPIDELAEREWDEVWESANGGALSASCWQTSEWRLS
jgi:hypothetical protein